MKKITVYRVHYRESERGWGQDFWHKDFPTREEAKRDYDETNAKNTASRAPDYYIQADRIEEITVSTQEDVVFSVVGTDCKREALIDRAVRSTTTPWHRKNWNDPHHVAIWSVRDIRAEFRRLSGEGT